MKKVLAGVLSLMMVVSLAACSGEKDVTHSSGADMDESSIVSQVEGTTGDEVQTYDTVSDFLADPNVKESLDAMIEEMGTEGSFSASVSGTDTDLIYTFTFTEGALDGIDDETAIANLNEGLNSTTSTFGMIASSVQEVVKVDDIKVVVIYAKPDGTELVNRVFTAADAESGVDLTDPQIEVETSPDEGAAGREAEPDTTVSIMTVE